MSESNSKGMFERAKDRWLCAMICMAPHLKCRADRVTSIRNVADLMLMHASRAMFFRGGDLVAFPSLPRLAFMAGLNEKTVRRAINDLVELGLIRVQHRFEDSNYFYLVVPPAAEQHSRACLDLLTNPRNRTTSARQNTQQLSQGGDSYDEQTPLNVQGLSERHSDLHSISKSAPSERAAIIKPRDLAEEKRLSEGLQALKDKLSRSPDPFTEARGALGREAGAVVGKAMRDWGRDAEDVRAAIDVVRDFDGDVRDLAHELWEPDC